MVYIQKFKQEKLKNWEVNKVIFLHDGKSNILQGYTYKNSRCLGSTFLNLGKEESNTEPFLKLITEEVVTNVPLTSLELEAFTANIEGVSLNVSDRYFLAASNPEFLNELVKIYMADFCDFIDRAENIKVLKINNYDYESEEQQAIYTTKDSDEEQTAVVHISERLKCMTDYLTKSIIIDMSNLKYNIY